MLYVGLRKICENWKALFLEAIQIALVMVLFSFLYYSLKNQMTPVLPFQDLLKEKGVQFYTSEAEYYVTEDGNYHMEELQNNLTGLKEYFFSLYSGIYVNEKDFFEVIGVNPRLSAAHPELESGVWFSECTGSERIPVVVTDNSCGIKTGDEIYLMLQNEQGLITGAEKAYVCGCVKNGASYYNGSGIKKPSSVFDFYSTYNADTSLEDLEVPMLFMDMKDLEEYFDNVWVDSSFFIVFDNEITEEEYENNLAYLEAAGQINLLSDIRENTILYIKDRVSFFVPLILAVLIFAVAGTAVSSMIRIRGERNFYALLYSIGMKRSAGIGILMLQFAAEAILAVLLHRLLLENLERLADFKGLAGISGTFTAMMTGAVLLLFFISMLIINCLCSRKKLPVSE